MLKRILFLLIANIVTISSFCQVTLTQEPVNSFGNDQLTYAIITSAATFISSMIAIFS